LKSQNQKIKLRNSKVKGKRSKAWMIFFLFFLRGLLNPVVTISQEVNQEGWPIPDLKGLIPYSIDFKILDGVEKVVEKFYIPDNGHVARISGNGKIFAYVVDRDREPPIDYLLLDPDGLGNFKQKFRSEDSFKIPEWVSY
jgi:hypothetical protein